MSYSYLPNINSPKDLRALPESAIAPLCEEIRAFLIEKVEKNGGHLASNLGVVELTVALHRLFDFEKDHLIFDVGHQSYVHKLLTGRRDAFDTLRTPGGLSGFTVRTESPYDAFGAGHSSTAISAAIGLLESDRIKESDAYTVAVIGDGAYTGGMVHEALNNLPKSQRFILILNENEMSISQNIGRFARYIAKVRTKRHYVKAKRFTTKFLSHIPLLGKPTLSLFRKIKQKMKNTLYNSNYFEELGLFYIGPIDGNDYTVVSEALEEARAQGENVIVHIKTVKGKGYPAAEAEPSRYHNVPPADAPRKSQSFHRVFGETLSLLADENPQIAAITAAMEDGTGLNTFKSQHKERFFDVGIAEEHAVTFAAGLAANGMTPFFAVYSTFLQRAYDNILHDVALQSLPVKLAVDRAGLAVSDGATHHGIFDVSFLSHIPNMEIFAPATYETMRAMLRDMSVSQRPQAIRYPNDTEDPRVAPLFYPSGDYRAYGVRASFGVSDTPSAIVITYGSILSRAIDLREKWAKDGKELGIILLETLKPYDKTASKVLPYLKSNIPTVFLEEGILDGGAGMLLSDRLYESGYTGRIKLLAIRDHFVIPDTPTDIYEYAGIGIKALEAALEN